jgi:hypothetical protein
VKKLLKKSIKLIVVALIFQFNDLHFYNTDNLDYRRKLFVNCNNVKGCGNDHIHIKTLLIIIID